MAITTVSDDKKILIKVMIVAVTIIITSIHHHTIITIIIIYTRNLTYEVSFFLRKRVVYSLIDFVYFPTYYKFPVARNRVHKPKTVSQSNLCKSCPQQNECPSFEYPCAIERNELL